MALPNLILPTPHHLRASPKPIIVLEICVKVLNPSGNRYSIRLTTSSAENFMAPHFREPQIARSSFTVCPIDCFLMAEQALDRATKPKRPASDNPRLRSRERHGLSGFHASISCLKRVDGLNREQVFPNARTFMACGGGARPSTRSDRRRTGNVRTDQPRPRTTPPSHLCRRRQGRRVRHGRRGRRREIPVAASSRV